MAPSLGEHLRKLREERNISLEQAVQGTHIRIGYLIALESDDRDLLPSPVQGKGFLRVYGNYLGVPVQPLLDMWEGKNIAEEQVLPVDSSAEPPAQSEPFSESLTAQELAAELEAPTEQEEDEYAVQEVLHGKSPANHVDSETGSEKMFRQIGEQLRRQREAISLSLSDVERFTRVRQRYLVALEEGNIDDLPSPVQGRGMLGNYAHFLSLDSDALLLQFAEGLQARRLERMAPPQSRSARLPQASKNRRVTQASPARLTWRRFLTPDIVIGGTLFVLILAFIIWGAAQVTRMSAVASAVTPPSIAEMLQITESPLPSASEVSATEQTTPSPNGTEEGEPGELSGTDTGTEGTPEEIGDSDSNAAIQVYVVANQRAFLRIIADGEQIFNARTKPGAAYSFSADEQLELITGNAAALQVYYQQDDLGILGQNGEIVSLIFSPEQYVTPTPRFTPTVPPTATPTITPTPTIALPTPTITPYLP